jgi:large subunit ribosomal protein L16
MLHPKRTKFRKFQKGKKPGIDSNINQLKFGHFGLKAVESGKIPSRTLEAVRRVLTRKFKRVGQIWIRIFPDKPITRKPLEVRMGKGKGNPEFWAAVVEPGRILFEVEGVTLEVAQEAMHLAAAKLPIKTKFIVRRDFAA